MRRSLVFACFLLCGAATGGAGQLAPAGTGGVAALAHTLRQLGAAKRVLFIAAHPDDEDTQFLTYLSRGLGAQVAYLSLTRGDGGQNLIGAELGPDLGILRSEELLAARAMDGAQQFFTRAYDFGFSKTADETFRMWPRDSVLADVIAIIRRFRPQIIVSQFSGTPRDGHGHHQAAGILAREAFERLRGSAGGPVKYYQGSRFDSSAAAITLPGGRLDPLAGQSYFQVAMASRSLHRSQDMGALQSVGPNSTRLALIAGPPGAAPELFAGVDTVLPGRAQFVALIDSARAALSPWHPQAIVPLLGRAARELGPADSAQRVLLDQALAIAAGLVIDGVADDGIVTPGQRLQVEIAVWNAGTGDVRLERVELLTPAGWRVEPLDAAAAPVAASAVATRRFAVHVAADAPPSQPYFRRRPLVGDGAYDWSGVPPAWRGRPFEPPPVVARVHATVAGTPVQQEREVVYRYRDQAIGEIRRPLLIAPPFDVAISPPMALWRLGAADAPARFTIAVTNRTAGAARAGVRVTLPAGWPAVAPESLAFTREDESRTVSLAIAPPSGVGPGSYRVSVTATSPEGDRSSVGLSLIDYPHVRPRAVTTPAAATIAAARFELPPLARVGYVRGASDVVPEKLAAIGLPVELLGAESLARGDLSAYSAIIIGSRAYETDAALRTHNGRLLDYARGGGLLLVQYQQYQFVTGGFAPFPITIGRPHDRVTDEMAAVTPLVPDHPVFHYPNAIGAADWDGWVQERGLYFAREWDPALTALLEMADPDSPPVRGGLLVAPLGRGTYIYSGLSFFRQLPAGVPGAYRLFLNLLGLRRPNGT